MEERRLQDYLKELEDFSKAEDIALNPHALKSNKVVKEHSTMRCGFEAKDIITDEYNAQVEYTEKVVFRTDQIVKERVYPSYVRSWPNMEMNMGKYGSVMKEKEWRRTLACKLFEERHNAAFESDEGIDLLWEMYESSDLKRREGKKKKKSSKKDKYGDEVEEDEEEDDEFEMTNGQLCCLHAVKISAGKMNLGMGRQTLVKISKALKRINWLHHAKRQWK